MSAQTTRRVRRPGRPGQTQDPSQLIGQWVRLRQERTPVNGVLVHAVLLRGGVHGGQTWEWAVRTPDGLRIGTGRLEIEPLTPEHRTEVRRARWELSARLAERAGIHDPGAVKARHDLELLDVQTAAHP